MKKVTMFVAVAILFVGRVIAAENSTPNAEPNFKTVNWDKTFSMLATKRGAFRDALYSVKGDKATASKVAQTAFDLALDLQYLINRTPSATDKAKWIKEREEVVAAYMEARLLSSDLSIDWSRLAKPDHSVVYNGHLWVEAKNDGFLGDIFIGYWVPCRFTYRLDKKAMKMAFNPDNKTLTVTGTKWVLQNPVPDWNNRFEDEESPIKNPSLRTTRAFLETKLAALEQEAPEVATRVGQKWQAAAEQLGRDQLLKMIQERYGAAIIGCTVIVK